MEKNENFWSYRLHKLGTPKVLRTGRVDPLLDLLSLKGGRLKQYDLGPYCLQYRLSKNISRGEEQRTSPDWLA